jgi:hypothetical protein
MDSIGLQRSERRLELEELYILGTVQGGAVSSSRYHVESARPVCVRTSCCFVAERTLETLQHQVFIARPPITSTNMTLSAHPTLSNLCDGCGKTAMATPASAQGATLWIVPVKCNFRTCIRVVSAQ